MTAPVVIYTDGACKGTPGPGGWGALLQHRGREREIFGGEAQTTNNRMELTAVIRALESLKRCVAVEIYTDSQHVKNGMESWISVWKRNGPKTADRKPVKNADLWVELDRPVQEHAVVWHWVRGHVSTRATIAPTRSRIGAWKPCAAHRGWPRSRASPRAAVAAAPGQAGGAARHRRVT